MDVKVFGEVCVKIHLFIHKLLFRKITSQSRPQNRKRKKKSYVFQLVSEGTTGKMLAQLFSRGNAVKSSSCTG